MVMELISSDLRQRRLRRKVKGIVFKAGKNSKEAGKTKVNVQ